MRVAILCATPRGCRFVEKLATLAPDCEVVVFGVVLTGNGSLLVNRVQPPPRRGAGLTRLATECSHR